jgi:hypothetical protein
VDIAMEQNPPHGESIKPKTNQQVTARLTDAQSPDLILVGISTASLLVQIKQHHVNLSSHDLYILTSLIIPSFVFIIDALSFSAGTALRLFYYLASLVLWSLAFPLMPSNEDFALAIPVTLLLCVASILVFPPGELTSVDDKHPLTDGSLVSYLTVGWLTALMRRASSRAIGVDDIRPAGIKLSAQHALNEDGVPASHDVRSYGIERGMIRFIAGFCPGSLSAGVALSLCDVVLTLLAPFILQRLLEDRKVVNIVALLFTSVAQAACAAHATLQMRRVAMRTRSGLTALVCDRTLHVPTIGKTETIEPPVLLEVDILGIFYFIERMTNVWVVPSQLILSSIALVYILSWQSVLAGAAATVSLIQYAVGADLQVLTLSSFSSYRCTLTALASLDAKLCS